MKLNLEKYAALEAAKARREKLIADHVEALRKVDEEISTEQMKLGLGAYVPEGGPKKVKMSEVKRQQHAEIRAEAIRRGYIHLSGRKKGQPDVNRLRLEMRAEKEGVSVPTLIKRLEEARAKAALERVKALGKGKR